MSRVQKILVALAVVVAVAGTLAVVVAAFVLTFDASKAVAEAARISPDLSWLMPVSVDGAMMVGTVALMVMRYLARDWRYPALVVAAGAAISIACNGLHATGEAGSLVLTWQSRVLVSAIPPVMLGLSVHLLVELLGAFLKRPAGSPPIPKGKPAVASAPLASKIVRPRVTPVEPAAPVPPVVPAVPVPPVVSLVKTGTGRRGRRGSVVNEAERLARVAALRDGLGRRPKREEVKASLRVGGSVADALLKALDAASVEHVSAPNDRS